MKYQIYLNKETSISVNKLAEKGNKKPNTFIKEFLEGFMRIYNATEQETEKQLEELRAKERKNGDKQPKI